MRARLAAHALLALALAAGATVARAAEVEINPVVVSLGPGTKSAIVTVKNLGAEPARFELQARAWGQSPAGEMLLSATEDVAVFPPLLTLAPGEQRNVRIGAVVAPGPVEKTYRVFLQELAPPEKPEGPSQVRVLSRIGLPVFVAPPQVQDRTLIKGLAVAGGRARFQLVNDGNAHVRPTSVKVEGQGEDGAPVLERELTAWYVLAGGRRDYDLELPRDACAGVRKVVVTVAVGRDVLRSEASAPAACGP
jgi:fimbrial chaperone protein